MDDRRNSCSPRRVCDAAALGANASLQDGEPMCVHPAREAHGGTDRPNSAGRRVERYTSTPQVVHQRHMPKEPAKFHIPRKSKEKRELFQCVSTESREYEDMMTILTSSYIDTSSVGCFTYCNPRLVYSELLEKEFVEKRREMKADGRTEKELEESYCFLLADLLKLTGLCEKGLFVGHSRSSVMGNPSKGVYLSRYSDLLQLNSFTPGATGEILIFKVMKGKVKSIYENMKNALDPTPRFDSHLSKNASKVTSLSSYRAFELTQQYFYEYSFDELRQRPRQVCPYAVVSFQFKGKDAALPSKPLAPVRLNSQSAEESKERAHFTVWTGDLVKADEVLFQISLRSFSPPLLPHKLPEKLEIGCVMRLKVVTKHLPSDLFSYNTYSGSQEVVKNGHYCSLLEVTDRNRSATSLTKLLHELETKKVVLVTPLTERGFLFLLSSVQMATPAERGVNWKRCLQALFVFPETRDVSRCASSCASASRDASQLLLSGSSIMPSLNKFIPALHHALVKACAHPSPELSAGVEKHAREYLMGQNDGKARQYPMGDYDVKLDDGVKPFPAPKVPRVSQDGHLRSYLYNPAAYLLSVARAREMVAIHCGPEVTPRKSSGRGRESIGKVVTSNHRGGGNTQTMQQLIDLVVTCKRNAEIEVNREEGRQGPQIGPGRKRKMEQKMAERALKFLKASQEPGGHKKIPVSVESSHHSFLPGPLATVIDSVGLKDLDLLDDGSELATKLVNLLRGLNQAARGTDVQRPREVQQEGQVDLCPFDRLATKLGLPTNSDIDLRKQEELEEQTAGSISSLEGFSPSGETSYHVPTGKGEELCRRSGGYIDQKEEIPWVLIPITGLCTERYTQRDKNSPQDPRFHQLTMATSITATTDPHRKVPTRSPEASAPPSPALCPSPEPCSPPSPPLCPSPEPSPPPSLSQCPSPEPSPPPCPSQCPSPEPSPPPSPSQCPSPDPSPDSSPRSPSHCQSLQPNEFSSSNKNRNCANDKCLAPQTSWVFAGMSEFTEQKLPENERQNEGASVTASIKPYTPAASETSSSTLLPPAEQELGEERKGRETQPGENVTKLREEEGTVEKVDIIPKGHKGHDGETKEIVGGTVLPPMSSPPTHLLSNIDSIVDQHLGDFTSDMQCLLQEERIQYAFPQSPLCTSDMRTAALRHAHPTSLVSPFSQYVSFYNPCPPVHDYVSSLQDSMNSLMNELDDGSLSLRSKSKRAETDCELASSVSSFVASIRAANAKTESDDQSAVSGEQTAAVPREGEMWWSDPTSRHPDATNITKPPPSDVTLYAPMGPSVSVHTPATSAVLHPPNTSPQSPCSTTSSNLDRTVTQYRPTPDNSTTRTVYCTTEEKPVQCFQGVNCQRPELSSVSNHSGEPPQAPEQGVSGTTPGVSGAPGVSDAEPSTDSVPLVPPAAALNSLISQLQPEMFNHLLEIMKDIKRNSVQFYLHTTGPEEQLHKDIKEHLLQQGHVEQSPVAFMNQQGCDSKLLVIINNKDIAGHIHKIPDLASLKRQQSVMFLGIDTLDDIRNNSYNELFVSGGCIVSDDMLLNPDFISEDRVAALLMFLDQSSPENVWRWKVHCKTHKKLKEQARFRRDAAKLLDLLSAYHKRQIIEFLPYHHCDTMNHQSPDLDCLIELQARYTQYRHTIFLTEQCFEKFSTYFSCGIIVAGIEEILHDLTHLVGYHDVTDKHPLTDEMLPPQERIHNFTSGRKVQELLQQSSFPQLTDQLVPESSYREGVLQRPDQDFEMLKMAISQLRAERQAQQQRFNSQAVESNNALRNVLPSHTESGHIIPPFGGGAPTESAQLTPGRKAVVDTLELIHSTMQAEDNETLAAGQRRGGRPETRDQKGETDTVTSVHQYTPLSNQNTAIVARSHDHTDLTNDCKDKRDHQEVLFKAGHAIVSSSISCPVEGDRSRDTASATEPRRRLEGSVAAHSVAVAGTMVTELKVNPKPLAGQQPPKHQQHLTERLHQMQPLLQRSLYNQPRWNDSLLQRPHLHYSPGLLPAPSATLRGFQSLQGAPMWPAGLVPVPSATAAALVLGFQQTGRDLRGPGLLGGYHDPIGQGNSRHRGWQGGGGFNGM